MYAHSRTTPKDPVPSHHHAFTPCYCLPDPSACASLASILSPGAEACACLSLLPQGSGTRDTVLHQGQRCCGPDGHFSDFRDSAPSDSPLKEGKSGGSDSGGFTRWVSLRKALRQNISFLTSKDTTGGRDRVASDMRECSTVKAIPQNISYFLSSGSLASHED
ncbi:hypothetical protein O3P69_020075 [Scylla paramamosain]|uniref:Uncharacterized protein n=1 Tax=Scylla paramamosain TaxID=85552 RepID=A0AAW0TKB3_SCYPA